MRAFALGFGTLLVGAVQVLAGFFIWRYGVIHKSETAEEAIYLPWLEATVAYGALFWCSGFLASKPRTRWIVAIAVALAAGLSSFLTMLTICANKFGT
jgi:hypothetical protein